MTRSNDPEESKRAWAPHSYDHLLQEVARTLHDQVGTILEFGFEPISEAEIAYRLPEWDPTVPATAPYDAAFPEPVST